jgi:ABC-type nitrate/sulfonate/bicarbonate transport system substrate-binding protein
MAIAVLTGTLAEGAGAAQNGRFTVPKYLKGPAPASVKIGLSGGYAFNPLAEFVAMGAGYFAAVGNRFHTNISFDVFTSGAASEAAYLGGSDQWVSTAQAVYVPAALGGKDQFGIVNQNVNLGLVFIGPQKYQASRGTNVSAYGTPGNTWCQVSAVGVGNTGLLLMAAVNNVPTSAMNLTTIGATTAAVPNIQSGRCTIADIDANTAAIGQIEGVSYNVKNTCLTADSVSIAGEQEGTGQLTTSHAFVKQYPKLTQAMVDADIAGLLFIQNHASNPGAIYQVLPAAMQQSVSLGAFVQAFNGSGGMFAAPYINGEYPVQEINDSMSLLYATNTVTANAPINPAMVTDNTHVIQAYKDLGVTPASGPQNGPAKLPTTVGKPSAEMAKAYSILTGQPVPANTGPAPLGVAAARAASSTTTTTAATTTSG